MTDKINTLCFTGHRHYCSEEQSELRLAQALETAYADGYRSFISGMAEGFDLAAAEAVLRLGEQHSEVRLIAALPFRGQPSKFSAENKVRYQRLLDIADHIAVLSEHYHFGCYHERDDWMVERSSRMICWYDGSSGGTRYTVKSAIRSKLEIVNLYREQATLF